jgi:hypothetical protein
MGLSSKQLKTTLEKYGYQVIRFFYKKKYYVYAECVFKESNIPVLIKLEEMLKFSRSDDVEDYKLRSIDISELLRTNFRYENQKINLDEEEFEKELIKKYKKNAKMENMMEIQYNNLIQMHEQQLRLNTIINKSNFSVALIDDGHMSDGMVYELKNYPESGRKMYITFSLQQLYDNSVNIKKNILQIYNSVDETLSKHFLEQLEITEELVKNYKIDYNRIKDILGQHKLFGEEYSAQNDELKDLLDKRQNIKSILEKNKEKMGQLDYERLRTNYEPKLEKLDREISESRRKCVDTQLKQKFVFLKVDQIIFDNLKYIQFIRKNLMELNNLFS